MIDQLFVSYVDLIPLKCGRDRNHHGELLGITSEVVRHRHHGPVTIPNEDHLRRLVE